MSFIAPTIEKDVEKTKSEIEKKIEIECDLIEKIQFLLSLKVGDSFLMNLSKVTSLSSIGRKFNVHLEYDFLKKENDKGEIRVWRVA